MKLVLTTKGIADWVPADDEISRIGLFHRPLAEEQGHHTIKSEDLDAIFETFIRVCVPDGSRAYGRLCLPFTEEYNQMTDDFREAGIATGPPVSVLRILFRGTPSWFFVGDVNHSQIMSFYKTYAGWILGPYQFLVSDSPIDNWLAQVKHLDKPLQKDFLRTISGYLYNHQEEGMEFVSYQSKTETLEREARALAIKLNVPFEFER